LAASKLENGHKLANSLALNLSFSGIFCIFHDERAAKVIINDATGKYSLFNFVIFLFLKFTFFFVKNNNKNNFQKNYLIKKSSFLFFK